jgi:hypothetical protein
MSKVHLLKTQTNPPQIAQSRLKREWMDNTYNKHAYQCLPMTYANVYGWELQLEQDVVVEWNGGNVPPTIISGEKIETALGANKLIVHSSIIGMISFSTQYVFRTDPNYDIWIGGSPNYMVDGAKPLSAIIPSSWWPDEFQMNWMITKVNEPVVCEAGMPFMFFTLFDNRVLEETTFEVSSLWDDKELVEQRSKYGDMKAKNNQENPWTWTKGIKTGLDADGNRIGPTFTGLPKLTVPER